MNDVERRIVECRAALARTVSREAGAVLRYEECDDLVQGICETALHAAAELDVRGDEAFRAWLWTVARRYLAARKRYWGARKRDGGRVLRLGATHGAPPLVDTATGPITFADRREHLILAARAIALLLPRDRDLVRWSSEDVDVDTIARRLGISRDAAVRARSRALERLRKTFLVVSRR